MTKTAKPSAITNNKTIAALLPVQSTPNRFTILVSRYSMYFGMTRETNRTKISVKITPLTNIDNSQVVDI